MADKYLGFTFNGESIGIAGGETHTGFIKNDGLELMLSSAPSFSDNFANIALGDSSFYTGTSIESRTFPLTIVLKDNTFTQYRAFLKWLNLRNSGYLVFDYNPDFGYMVKVSSIGDAEIIVVSQDDVNPEDSVYNIELRVEFITTGDWAAVELNLSVPATPALWYWEADTSGVVSKKTFSIDWDVDNITLTNSSELDQHFILEFNSAINITLPDTSTLVVANGDLELMKYYSQYGVVINTSTDNFVSGTISAYSTSPGDTGKVITGDGNINRITMIAREII